ncbi:SDR family NAD(P)-dependent oxidoreductase [Legionella saoudiensis]|uniref:SDR family NAD(P)-dependent oxidoreductase n=1 Tax=Legionella saoudiensis TaxID=1750561 RepID=UPI000730549B|nr:SDR family NAD(P)-dependent oxidoreductase [Legionella saoudiensis]
MNKKTILITGCSSGIGLDAAQALQKKGYQVIASCRKKEDQQHLIALGLDTVLLDVNDSESIKTAFAEVLVKTDGRLDVLINNAGYGQVGALEDVSRETLRQQFETNVFGLLELSALAIPVMRQQGEGRIINISSILGIISLPFRGAYNASKYAVEGLSDTLRLELKSSGIKVITIEPGPIESRFRDNCVEGTLTTLHPEKSYFNAQYSKLIAAHKQTGSKSFFTKTPEAVIHKLIHAIESKNPRAKYPVTFPAHLLIFLKRILSTKMLDRFLLRASKSEVS